MGYNEFMEGQRTETELRVLCNKVDNEIKLEIDRLKKVRLLDETGNDLYGIDLDNYEIIPSTEYDVSLLEAIAGNCSGFAAIAERDVQKNGLKKADGKWNNYVVALREMGYPCMNSFLYLQCIKANQQSEAKEYLNKALEQKVKIILCTPTWDNSYYQKNEKYEQLLRHAEQVRCLAEKYNLGLADSFKAFERHILDENDLAKYLSHVNHPTEAGHMLVAEEIAKYFVAR